MNSKVFRTNYHIQISQWQLLNPRLMLLCRRMHENFYWNSKRFHWNEKVGVSCLNSHFIHLLTECQSGIYSSFPQELDQRRLKALWTTKICNLHGGAAVENSEGRFFKIYISFYYGDMLDIWEILICDGWWFMSFSYVMKQKNMNHLYRSLSIFF